MKKQDWDAVCLLALLSGLALFGYTVVGLMVFNGLSLTGLIWMILGIGFYKI